MAEGKEKTWVLDDIIKFLYELTLERPSYGLVAWGNEGFFLFKPLLLKMQYDYQ